MTRPIPTHRWPWLSRLLAWLRRWAMPAAPLPAQRPMPALAQVRVQPARSMPARPARQPTPWG